jgi:hypothetical protein
MRFPLLDIVGRDDVRRLWHFGDLQGGLGVVNGGYDRIAPSVPGCGSVLNHYDKTHQR